MLKTVRILPLGLLLVVALLPMQVVSQQGAAVSQNELQITPDVVYGHKAGMAVDVRRAAPRECPRRCGAVHGERRMGVTLDAASALGRSNLLWPSRRGADRHRRAAWKRAALQGPPRPKPTCGAPCATSVCTLVTSASTQTALGVFGGSAGGHLSLMLGLGSDEGESDSTDEVLRTPARVAAAVAYYPPVDIRPITGANERFPALDFPQEQAAAISPILFVTPDYPPTLLIHGDADTLVPISASEIMYAALQAESIESEFITIEGGDHGFRNQEHRARAQAAMVAWFAGHLAPGSGG